MWLLENAAKIKYEEEEGGNSKRKIIKKITNNF